MNKQALVESAQRIADYTFTDHDLAIQALTHASIAETRLQSNERLEFLGDAVLGMVVCDELYRSHPESLEGDLTKIKSFVVSRRVCAKVADQIGLTELLILGNGINTDSTLPVSLRAAVHESMIGAIYLDGGLEPARRFILNTMKTHIDRCKASDHQENHKSALQQYAQRWLMATPHYERLDEQGPDHNKCFKVCVVISGKRYPSAWGASKKEAEQEAARITLQHLKDKQETK